MAQTSDLNRTATALVTGASSGIGYELSLLLARQGYNLVLVSRGRPALEALAERLHDEFGVHAEVCPKDLTVQSAPDELFAELKCKDLSIEVLINDAGFATQGPFKDNDQVMLLDMLQVNVMAV